MSWQECGPDALETFGYKSLACPRSLSYGCAKTTIAPAVVTHSVDDAGARAVVPLENPPSVFGLKTMSISQPACEIFSPKLLLIRALTLAVKARDEYEQVHIHSRSA